MEELNDYSGEFNSDLKLTDFSKETLIRMWVAAAKLSIVPQACGITLMPSEDAMARIFKASVGPPQYARSG